MKKSNSDSFVPTFVIYINNIRIALEKEVHVKEIQVSENLNFPSTALITFSDIMQKWQSDNDFNEGNDIKILLGYKDRLDTLFEGIITGKKVRLSEKSSLAIKCSDPLFRFDSTLKIRAFYNTTAHEIIKKISREYSLNFETDVKNKNYKSFVQHNKSDLEVIRELADRDFAQITVKDNKILVKKISGSDDDAAVLEWGKTLSEINADLDCTELKTKVDAESWNSCKTEVVKGQAFYNDLKIKLEERKSGQALFYENFGEAYDRVFIVDLKDSVSCEEAALARLTENSFNFIKARGKSTGNNRIKAGKVIKIKGIGDVFSGNYLINSARHILSQNGYITEFSISKNC